MSVDLYNPHAVGRDEIGEEKAKEKISHRFASTNPSVSSWADLRP
jgi:hypothetical protein